MQVCDFTFGEDKALVDGCALSAEHLNAVFDPDLQCNEDENNGCSPGCAVEIEMSGGWCNDCHNKDHATCMLMDMTKETEERDVKQAAQFLRATWPTVVDRARLQWKEYQRFMEKHWKTRVDDVGET